MNPVFVRLVLGGATLSLARCVSEPASEAPAARARPAKPAIAKLELLNVRAVRDGDSRPVFDAVMTPRLRFRGRVEKPKVRFEDGTRSWRVRTEAVTRGPWTLIHTKTSTVPQSGPGLVVLLDGRGTELGRRAVEWRPAPERLRDVRRARKLGSIDEAQSWVERLSRPPPTEDWWTQVWLLEQLGGRLMGFGDLSGADEAWKAAGELATANGMRSIQVRMTFSRSYLALEKGNYGAVDHLLEEIEPQTLPNYPRARIWSSFYRGEMFRYLGVLREAERHLRTAKDEAAHQAEAADALWAGQSIAMTLEQGGRFAEALEEMATLSGPTQNDRTRANHLLNLGWLLLRATDARAIPSSLPRAQRTLEEARALFLKMDRRDVVPNIDVNLAWLAVRLGDLEAADAHLATGALHAPEDGRVGLFARVVRSELELARENFTEASRAARSLIEHATREGHAEFVWQARSLLGEAYEMSDAPDRALREYETAYREMRLQAARTTAFQRRHPFVHRQRRLCERWAAILIRRGQLWEAFWLLNHVHSAVYRQLDEATRPSRHAPAERARWAEAKQKYERVPLNFARSDRACPGEPDCRPPRGRIVDELLDRPALPFDGRSEALRFDDRAGLLAVFPWKGGWLSFFQHGDRPLQLSERTDVVAAWKKHIEALRFVAVLSNGNVEAERLHAREVGGRPLAASLIVSHVPFADLLLRDDRPFAHPSPHRALIIVDPTQDLPMTRREGETAAAHHAGPATILRGQDASRSAVLRSWSNIDLLHFGGHGVFRSSQPWQAHLSLHGADAIRLEDIFVHQPRIRHVVLNGCRTGSAETPGVIGLPAAFLVAGATWVLATVRDLEDGEAARFVERFYASGGATEPGLAYQRAMRASFDAHDHSWTAFRLWGNGAPFRITTE